MRLGLEALAGAAPDQVLIHDAARPFVGHDVISRVIDALGTHAGAIAAEPLTDTLKRASATGTIAGTVDRGGLWRAQTPQGFRFAPILDAHRRAASEGREDFTDDASLAEWAGIEVALVRGSSRNIKITHAEDLAMAERLLTADSGSLEPRIGTGFDVHRFGPGDHVWLGGVRIAHTAGPRRAFGCRCGAACADRRAARRNRRRRYRGAFSAERSEVEGCCLAPLRRGCRGAGLRRCGGRISNVDITLLCEAPRIGPHRDAMRACDLAHAGDRRVARGRQGDDDGRARDLRDAAKGWPPWRRRRCCCPWPAPDFCSPRRCRPPTTIRMLWEVCHPLPADCGVQLTPSPESRHQHS